MRFLALMSIATIGVICLLDLFWRVGEGGGVDLGGMWLASWNAEQWGDHEYKKFLYEQFCWRPNNI